MKKVLKILAVIAAIWMAIAVLISLYFAVIVGDPVAQEDMGRMAVVLVILGIGYLIRRIFSQRAYRNLRLMWFLFGALAGLVLLIVVLINDPAAGLFMFGCVFLSLLIIAVFWKRLRRNTESLENLKQVLDVFKS